MEITSLQITHSRVPATVAAYIQYFLQLLYFFLTVQKFRDFRGPFCQSYIRADNARS